MIITASQQQTFQLARESFCHNQHLVSEVVLYSGMAACTVLSRARYGMDRTCAESDSDISNSYAAIVTDDNPLPDG